jgi:hypothetical protein
VEEVNSERISRWTSHTISKALLWTDDFATPMTARFGSSIVECGMRHASPKHQLLLRYNWHRNTKTRILQLRSRNIQLQPYHNARLHFQEFYSRGSRVKYPYIGENGFACNTHVVACALVISRVLLRKIIKIKTNKPHHWKWVISNDGSIYCIYGLLRDTFPSLNYDASKNWMISNL